MKNNKKKTNHSSSFGRLWSYLQAYRFPLYLAIFLKIVSVIMSVLEPVVIGLAITELTKNTLAIIKGVEGARINVSYVGWVLVVYLLRGLIYELAAYYSKARLSNLVQVDMIEAKKLNKPTGGKPGFVTYTGQKTLRVTPEEEKIKAMKLKD